MNRLCTTLACVLCLSLPGHLTAQVNPGIITTFAGGGVGDGGLAIQASLNYPTSVAVDAKGNIYMADPGNGRIRRVGLDGIITTFEGGGTLSPGSIGEGGPATQARLNNPENVALDPIFRVTQYVVY